MVRKQISSGLRRWWYTLKPIKSCQLSLQARSQFRASRNENKLFIKDRCKPLTFFPCLALFCFCMISHDCHPGGELAHRLLSAADDGQLYWLILDLWSKTVWTWTNLVWLNSYFNFCSHTWTCTRYKRTMMLSLYGHDTYTPVSTIINNLLMYTREVEEWSQ